MGRQRASIQKQQVDVGIQVHLASAVAAHGQQAHAGRFLAPGSEIGLLRQCEQPTDQLVHEIRMEFVHREPACTRSVQVAQKVSNPLSVLANDSEGATVDTNLLVYPLHGSIQMLANGTFVYTHDGSESSSDGFIYEVYNQYGTASGTVTIQVLTPAASGIGETATRRR